MKKNKLLEIIRESIENTIYEIGEGSSKPYKIINVSEDAFNILTFKFILDDHPEYEGIISMAVGFEYSQLVDEDVRGVDISFNIVDKGQELGRFEFPQFKVTNFGLKTMFRIMSTIGEALEHTGDYFNSKNGKRDIYAIGFETSGTKASRVSNTSGRRFLGQEQRKKLYDAFIRRNFVIKNGPIKGRLGTIWYRLEDPI
jgi:hypothetical protein